MGCSFPSPPAGAVTIVYGTYYLLLRFEMVRRREYRPPNDDDDDVDPLLGPLIRWHCSLPPVTRIWFSLALVITILNVLEVLDDDKLIFVAIRVLPPHLELWRIITSFAWAGPGTLMDFHVLLLLYSITNVVPVYEMDPHEAKRG